MSDTNQTNSDEQLFQKKASFIQHSLPGLEAGSYEISVQQKFLDSGGKSISGEPLQSLTKQFGVQGPRYSLPANAVHSVFPPASEAGEFSGSLPHVVLSQEKIPWIRTPYLPGQEPIVEERRYTASIGGTDKPIVYDDDKATWMMVLLLTPQDLDGQEPQNLIVQGKASDLVPSTLQMTDPGGGTTPGTLPANGYSIFSYRLEPGATETGAVDPDPGHTPAETCSYIDLPAALFNKLAPSLTDLEMMAHVRSVEMDAKALQPGETVQPQESFGLVLGNRLPQTTPAVPPLTQNGPAVGKNVALLVSLENMQQTLRGHSSESYYEKSVSEQTGGFVRLIVLYQWSFTSWSDTSFEFETILKGLNGRDPNSPNATVKVPNPMLRLPNPPNLSGTDDQKIVQEMIELGYTPMNHLTRVPDVEESAATEKIQTVSWYRGPLIPFEKQPSIRFVAGDENDSASQEPIFFSPDELLRFDPNVGMYDTSYAAAWQLGRLVALRDKSFSVNYYRWTKTVNQKYRMLLENKSIELDHQNLMSLFQNMMFGGETRAVDKPLYRAVINFLAQTKKTK
jgi:hypothetical protein